MTFRVDVPWKPNSNYKFKNMSYKYLTKFNYFLLFFLLGRDGTQREQYSTVEVIFWNAMSRPTKADKKVYGKKNFMETASLTSSVTSMLGFGC